MGRSAQGAIADRATIKGNILHGSDVPKGKSSFEVTVEEVYVPEGTFNGVACLQVKEVFGKDTIVLNVTNTRAISKLLGDDMDKWEGKKIRFEIIYVRNPKTGKNVPSLGVAE